MSRPKGVGQGDPAALEGADFRLPESGLAEEILAAYGASQAPASAPAAPPEPPLPAGPERLYALADRLANATRRAVEAAPEAPETWVTVGIGAELYAVPVESVEEVLRVTAITRLPYAPHAVRGVTHHRGRVLTVLDLRVRLGQTEIEITPQSRIAVVASRGRSIGLLVDSAYQVVKVLPSAVQAPPGDVMTERSHFIVGVVRSDLGLLILLDVDRVLLLDPEDAGDDARADRAPGGDD